MSVERRHGPDCPCPRCQGFQLGNQLSKGHGSPPTHAGYAMLRLAPRAAEIAGDLREIVPAASVADEPTIRLLALVLARIEVVNEWLVEHGIFRNARGEIQPVLKALSTWENSAARLLDRLGCTPTSRAQLGLDLTRARGEALRAHVAKRYPDVDVEGEGGA